MSFMNNKFIRKQIMKSEVDLMKKKLLTGVLVATMLVSTLTGCGGSGSGTSKSDTMTVSEMLNAVLEDNDGEILIYREESATGNVSVGKDLQTAPFFYDGNNVGRAYYYRNTSAGTKDVIKPSLGRIAQDDFSSYLFEKATPASAILCLATDATGNSVEYETLSLGTEGEKIYFDEFERIEIYDTTFMYFRYVRSDNPYYYYTFIEDTASTKDKTIVLDEIGTEGIKVD